MRFVISATSVATLGTTIALTAFSPAYAVSPEVTYTAEQTAVCQPRVVADSDSVDDKVNTSSKTIWARSVVAAPEGRAFDPRPEAMAYSVNIHHMNENGSPVVTARLNGLLPTRIELASKDHRGGSLRLSRTIKAENQLVATSVVASLECFAALGLFE